MRVAYFENMEEQSGRAATLSSGRFGDTAILCEDWASFDQGKKRHWQKAALARGRGDHDICLTKFAVS